MVKPFFAGCCAILLASSALACGVMEKADPRVGSTVASAERVTLMFSETIVPDSSGVKVTGAGGDEVKTDAPVSSKGDTVLSLKPLHPLASGTYKVTWSVLWKDCDSQTQGSYKFTVAP